jgi:plasmid stabilization system protein ParE
MNPTMQITWSSKASNDLTRLLTYTRDERSISTARQRLTLIEGALLRLAQWPDSGRQSDKKNVRVFYAPLPECKIIYRIETYQQLTILRLEPDHTRPLHPRIDF